MNESTLDARFEATAAERRRLVGLLSERTKEPWARHRLCKGWPVREVVAHIAAVYRLTPEAVLAEVAAAAGDGNAACDVLATRDTAQYGDAELLAGLAENVTLGVTGRRLVAGDCEWSMGDGADVVEAPMAGALLKMAGRRPLRHAVEPASVNRPRALLVDTGRRRL